MKQNRIPYNLSHYSFMTGRIGMLKTLSIIPVLAGDSITLQMNSILRLSPLRRTLMVNAIVDYFAFYVPHRHSYGSAWVDMIKEGASGSSVMPEIDVGSGLHYLANPLRQGYGTAPQYLWTGYNQIWNRYFRFLQMTPEVPDTYNGTGTPAGHTAANSPLKGTLLQRIHGFNCARIKTPWTTGIVTSIVAADKEVASATVLNIVDLAQVKKAYKTKEEREWFAQRYNDVLRNSFGSGVNIDADERPELLNRKRVSIGGHDVDGTADANLGTYSSKAITGHQFGIRRKFMPEHGAIFVMALVRFPTIAFREQTALNQLPQTYPFLSGDADLAKVEEPQVTNLKDWIGDSASLPIGTVPHGQWWRFQPNVVDRQYEEVEGFPFLQTSEINTHVKAIYMGENDYTSTFQTTQLGQWQCQSAMQVEAHRNFPSSKTSIYAGT